MARGTIAEDADISIHLVVGSVVGEYDSTHCLHLGRTKPTDIFSCATDDDDGNVIGRAGEDQYRQYAGSDKRAGETTAARSCDLSVAYMPTSPLLLFAGSKSGPSWWSSTAHLEDGRSHAVQFLLTVQRQLQTLHANSEGISSMT